MRAPDAETVRTNGHAPSEPASWSAPSDETIIEKCPAAGNAAKFADLYDHGNVRTHHGGDDSAADLGLLGILTWWTQDEAQLERLVSSSALGRREKWRRRDDYRKRTVRKALADLGETYDWSKEVGTSKSRPMKKNADEASAGDE